MESVYKNNEQSNNHIVPIQIKEEKLDYHPNKYIKKKLD